jgi:hypothetical protein
MLSGDGYKYIGSSSTPNIIIKKSPNKKLARNTGNDMYLKMENI